MEKKSMEKKRSDSWISSQTIQRVFSYWVDMIPESSAIEEVKISPISSNIVKQKTQFQNSSENSSKNERQTTYLVMRKMRVLSGFCHLLSQLLITVISTRLSRNKLLISYISSSRIIHLPMGTNELVLFSLSGFSRKIVTDSRQMVR
jgi:hypothetical protein